MNNIESGLKEILKEDSDLVIQFHSSGVFLLGILSMDSYGNDAAVITQASGKTLGEMVETYRKYNGR